MRPAQNHIAVVAATLVLVPSIMQAASDQSAKFPALWTQYLEVCGTLIQSPEDAFTQAAPFATGKISSWGAAEDGSSVHGSIANLDHSQEASFHLIRSESGFALFCEAHIFDFNGIDVDATAYNVRRMLEAGGQMSIKGGNITDVSGGSQSLAASDQLPWNALVVSGAFPGAEISTAVDIQKEAMTVTLFGHIR